MVLYPIKVIDIELSRPIPTVEGLEGYMGLQALVRLHGVPLGYVKAPISLGRCTAETLGRLILEQHRNALLCQLINQGLASPQGLGAKLSLEDCLNTAPTPSVREWPLVTVAVCTRDRTADLVLCLDALCQLDYPHLDLLVVDNAPTNDATERLVRQYRNVRYIREPRPGLDWARNRAILEAKGEIIAYTDDDVVVDAGWVKALAQVFIDNSEVMAVTGLVVPYELETEAQVLFEMYGGFGRGFERKWYRNYPNRNMPWRWLGAGQYGTGANMAYRRSVFEQIGGFDPALDVGTVTNGAGDLEMFFRILKNGHTLVYEPGAIIRHRHRREYVKLRTQLANNGSLYSYFICSTLAYPGEGFSFAWLGIWWLFYWNLRRLLMSFIYPMQFPRDLIWAEFKGSFVGLTRYSKACKIAAQIAEDFHGEPTFDLDRTSAQRLSQPLNSQPQLKPLKAIAVRTIELDHPLQPILDVATYAQVRLVVIRNGITIGAVDIANQYQPIGTSWLRQAISHGLALKLLRPPTLPNHHEALSQAEAILRRHFLPLRDETSEVQLSLPATVSASILVGTYDRPDDLRRCLKCLTAQQSSRKVEVIVVDNNPSSGVTPPVVAEFPGVILVSEPRKGVAYARNAGIAASTGDIILTTDDDVTMPPTWLEKLITPFVRPDVMLVSGNILPVELETESQLIFEHYGGLGRGFHSFEVNGNWFERSWCRSVPTWDLGGTANSAFRASIFHDPKIGLMDETLGPGMPSGVGEDSYLFYKVLKAGYTLVYEPTTYVWHRHRSNMSALRRQIYNYSKGHVSHHLTTLLRDGDFRAIARLLVGLPLVHGHRIYWRLRGWSEYPIRLILWEILGNLTGPWSLWQSHRRVNREGRSAPYVPPSQRPQANFSQSNLLLEEAASTVSSGSLETVTVNRF
ncbi:MAG TPA: glycosyltransferase [Leptolyngbyaceae cyanobacterium]